MRRINGKYFLQSCALTCILFSPLRASLVGDGLSVITFGSFSAANSDIQGNLAVGGDLNLQNYALNQTAGPATLGGYNTVTGGNFSLTNGTLYGTAHSASASFMNSNVCSGCSTTGSTPPIDFSSLEKSAKDANRFLYHLTPTGTSTTSYGTLLLKAEAGASLQIFSITAAQLGDNSGIEIDNLDPDATVVINISDSGSHAATTSAAGLVIDHNPVQSADHVVFNFDSSITNISIANSFYASILAPDASLTGSYGLFNGDLVAARYNGNNQFNVDPFTGTLPTCPTPEPATFAMLAGALGLGFGLRKRQRSVE